MKRNNISACIFKTIALISAPILVGFSQTPAQSETILIPSMSDAAGTSVSGGFAALDPENTNPMVPQLQSLLQPARPASQFKPINIESYNWQG